MHVLLFMLGMRRWQGCALASGCHRLDKFSPVKLVNTPLGMMRKDSYLAYVGAFLDKAFHPLISDWERHLYSWYKDTPWPSRTPWHSFSGRGKTKEIILSTGHLFSPHGAPILLLPYPLHLPSIHLSAEEIRKAIQYQPSCSKVTTRTMEVTCHWKHASTCW